MSYELNFENFDGYYVGWAILILVLLWILVCAGYYYADDGDGYSHLALDGDLSYSPGHGGHHHGGHGHHHGGHGHHHGGHY